MIRSLTGLILLATLSSSLLCDESSGCNINMLQNSTFLMLSQTTLTSYNEIKLFNKTVPGYEIFCSPLWGGTLQTACLTLSGELCSSNCTISPDNFYRCTTASGSIGFCDMDRCSNSSSNHLNSVQTSSCTDMCKGIPCNGGNEYCNTTFLTKYYNVTSGLIYGNLTSPLITPVPFTGCLNTSQCFCRVGTYVKSLQSLVNYTVTDYTYQSFSTCTSQISNHQVKIFCPSSNYTLQVLINGVILYNSVFTSQISLDLPSTLPSKSSVSIYVLKDYVVYFTDTLYTTDEGVCRVQSCILCKDFFDQWDCQTLSSQILSIVFLFLLLFCAYIIIAFIVAPTASVCLVLCGIFNNMSNFLKRYLKPSRMELLPTSSDSKIQSRSDSPIFDISEVKVSRKKPRSSISSSNVAVLTIVCLFSYSEALCTDNPTQISSFPLCAYNGSDISCSLSFNIQSTLQYYNSTSCYILKSPNGDLLGNLELSFHKQYTISLGKFIYYTSNFKGAIESHNGCYEDSWCGNRCDNISPNDVSGVGQMTQPFRYCQGITRCARGPGCSTNGCWSCTAKCFVSRAVLDTRGYLPYSVYNFDSHSHYFELLYKLTYGNTTITKLLNITYLNSPTDSLFNLQLVGAFSPLYEVNRPEVAAAYSCLFGCSNPVRGPYSQVNAPIKGTIGEIHSSTLSAFSCPTDQSAISNLLWDKSIYTPSGQVSGSFSNPSILNMQPFPLVYAGNTWKFNLPNILSTNPLIPNPIQINIQTKVPLNITKKVSVVCPVAKFNNVTGFYKSTKGYQISFDAKSSCSAGEIEVSSFNCTTSMFTIDTVYSTYLLSCYSEDQSVSGTILIKSTIQSVTVSFHGNLNFTTDVVPNNDTLVITNSTSSGSSNPFGSLTNFFGSGILGFSTGLKTFMNKMLNIIIYIVAIIIIIVLFFYFIKFISRKRIFKGKQK